MKILFDTNNTRHFERISNINPLKPPEIFSLIKTLDI